MTSNQIRKAISAKADNEIMQRLAILATKYAALETRLHTVETKLGMSLWQKIRGKFHG